MLVKVLVLFFLNLVPGLGVEVNAVSFSAIGKHQAAMPHLPVFERQLIYYDLFSHVWRLQLLSVYMFVISVPDKFTVC